jgi:hypothetical protein
MILIQIAFKMKLTIRGITIPTTKYAKNHDSESGMTGIYAMSLQSRSYN